VEGTGGISEAAVGDAEARPPRTEEELDAVMRAAHLMVRRLRIAPPDAFDKLERVARAAGISVDEAARRLSEVLRHRPAV
jgi:hypothetical protein